MVESPANAALRASFPASRGGYFRGLETYEGGGFGRGRLRRRSGLVPFGLFFAAGRPWSCNTTKRSAFSLLFDQGNWAGIRCEGFIRGQQFDALLVGLGGKNSVEGIAMQVGKLPDSQRMCAANQKFLDGCLSAPLEKPYSLTLLVGRRIERTDA